MPFSLPCKKVRAAEGDLPMKRARHAGQVRLELGKYPAPRGCAGVWCKEVVEPGRGGRETSPCGAEMMSPGATSKAETIKPFLILACSKS